MLMSCNFVCNLVWYHFDSVNSVIVEDSFVCVRRPLCSITIFTVSRDTRKNSIPVSFQGYQTPLICHAVRTL